MAKKTAEPKKVSDAKKATTSASNKPQTGTADIKLLKGTPSTR